LNKQANATGKGQSGISTGNNKKRNTQAKRKKNSGNYGDRAHCLANAQLGDIKGFCFALGTSLTFRV